MSGPSPRHNSDGRRDRQLGIITQNKQRFEAFRADDALESVRRQVCPFCGEGPFTCPFDCGGGPVPPP